MFKAIVLLKRARPLSTDEFREWFVRTHAPRAIEIGGSRIRRYTASIVVAPGPRSDWSDGEAPFDIVSELWCDERATLDAVYADLAQHGSEMEKVLQKVSLRTSVIAEEIDLL